MAKTMPTLFIGHGSPMNAIEKNTFSDGWSQIAGLIPRPDAIISISAHWFSNGTKTTDSTQPEMVYDMYGFPEELYRVKYQPKGSPSLAHEIVDILDSDAMIDNSWGLDHGSWSVLRWMFPDADIPVIQLSVDADKNMQQHYEIGKQLSVFRENGVMIFGSGNIVHNLRLVNWDMNEGYHWAVDFDGYIKNNILNKNHENIINYRNSGSSADMAFPTADHFAPLLYVLGASHQKDTISIFNELCTLGSISMTSYLFN